ncbi:MAG TPA: VacJ family lipoprotein [Planctomycetota bacterium]|nr:VacJ family lipoprotein [Planctomycetota bacterium]
MPEPRARRPSGLAALLLSALIALLAGCADVQTRQRDWSAYDGPGAEYFRIEEPQLPLGFRDPLQPLNRDLFAVNDWLVDWIVSPISVGWRFVFRPTVRRHIAQFGTNLAFPTRALNDLVQGKLADAGQETARFAINTTVGLLGFFDPSTSWGLEAPRPEDTGQSLQKAGWADPAYLFIPLNGPSTVRDGVGLIGDTLTNIGYWFFGFPVTALVWLNRGSDTVLQYEQVVASQPDPYEMIRLAWSLMRAGQLNDVPTRPTEAREGEAEQTLQVLHMAPATTDFFRTGEEGEVLIPSTGRVLPFSYWLQDAPPEGEDPAPLLYILPGLGSHRLSNQALALVEAARREGWSVVTLSSAMHPEFMAAAATAEVPGFAPLDSLDVRAALDQIDAWMREHHPGRLGRRGLLGISMGAFHALLIAADQTREPDHGRVHFEVFGAAAPPVSTGYGLDQLDALYDEPMSWPPDERERRELDILQRVASLTQGQIRPGEPLPFSESEARYVVGLAFRLTLVDTLWDTQQRHDQGVLLTPRDPDDRDPAYEEMQAYSWREYFYAFLLPWLEARGLVADADEALQRSDLRSVAPLLAGNHAVHVFVSDNDFLRRPEDQELLVQLFGPECVHETQGGGHFGNGWRPDVRGRLMAELRQSLEETKP